MRFCDRFWQFLFFFTLLGVLAMTQSGNADNRLASEKSPYLLQHADNPVNWYPWGKEAFDEARTQNKPIFLSIGYSTCHWCHVMEEESFTNPAIAAQLNDSFVSIKVDREERPDIDHVYMMAVQAMTGQGGWPLTVFLTPDLKPFYGGTYFPPEDRWGRPGFSTVLKSIRGEWEANRQRIVTSSDQLAKALQTELGSRAQDVRPLDELTLKTAYHQLGARFDSTHGGFGSAPKFPQGHVLSFLLRYWRRTGAEDALGMVRITLDGMAKGGVYDHLGGGFHRYSTDEEWFVPHFEKMLYDQAILARAYLEAYQATGEERYARVAREIFEYILRDMTGPEGAFYSAEDADSLPPDAAGETRKREGAFYLWYASELEHILGKETADVFNFHFGVRNEGNVANDPQGEFGGKNILFQAQTRDETAKHFGRNSGEIGRLLDQAKVELRELRAKRPRPHLDDKVLTDWNGLMISSLAFGSRVLDEPRYGEAAQRAADFILAKMKREDGRLMHRYRADRTVPSEQAPDRRLTKRYRDQDVSIPGFLEDYAFFANGLMDVYEATFDIRYLEEARFLLKEMHRLFWDDASGGFYLTGSDAESLILRAKDLQDGAIPSGNSVAALAMIRLGRLTLDRDLESWTASTLDAFSARIAEYPSAYAQMLNAIDFAVGPSTEVVISGDPAAPETQAMVREAFRAFIPNKVVALCPIDPNERKRMEALSPFVAKQVPMGGKPTAYVCQNYMCKLPTADLEQMKRLLNA